VQGAGKTELAQALKTKLEKTGKYKSIAIIDDYVQEISDETDLALGFYANYIGNIYVAMGRATRERIAAKDNDVVITCGTIFETASYTAQQLESEFSVISEENEKLDHLRRTEAAMKYISCLYIDVAQYDNIFHLPKVIQTEGDDLRIEELNKALLIAFDSFDVFPTTRIEREGDTMEEITNNRVKKVLETINANKS
jgi:hypothetical protein